MNKESGDMFVETQENVSSGNVLSTKSLHSTTSSRITRGSSKTQPQVAQGKPRFLSQSCVKAKHSSDGNSFKKPLDLPTSAYQDELWKLYGIETGNWNLHQHTPSGSNVTDQDAVLLSLRQQAQTCKYGLRECNKMEHLCEVDAQNEERKEDRRAWSCLSRKYYMHCLRKSLVPSSRDGLKKGSSSLTPRKGVKRVQKPEGPPNTNIPITKPVVSGATDKPTVSLGVRENKWNKFSDISRILTFLCGFMCALCLYIIKEYYFEHVVPSVSFPSTELRADIITGSIMVQKLENYMQNVAEELKYIREEMAILKGVEVLGISDSVDKNPTRDILEELFTGEPDLASAGNMGSVIATPDTTTLSTPAYLSVMNLLSFSVDWPHRPPNTVIKGLIQEVGDCWAFSGGMGRLVIALHKPTLITGVSISHVPSTVMPAGNVAAAPRHFRVLAHTSETDFENGIQLGSFDYDSKGLWRQRFKIDPQNVRERFRIIEFQFVSNHGHPDYTCVYRVHVHGITK